jgi:NAD+ synthase (glutamine-hydrolysing)
MKIALAQLNPHIGNFEANTQQVTDTYREAVANGARLVVYPELAICGYPPLDFLDYRHFVEKCLAAIDKIAHITGDAGIIIGAPSVNPDPKGKNLFNSAFYLCQGKIKKVVHKTLLPTYDVFDEYRWFEPGVPSGCIVHDGVKIALTVCEDLWNMDEDPLYATWPMEQLITENPSMMINIAASPFNYRHATDRKSILIQNIIQYQLPLVYVNHAGAQTDILFDGSSLVFNRSGNIIAEAAHFKPDLIYCDFDESLQDIKGDVLLQATPDKSALIYDALICGIRDYFEKMGFTKAIFGMSGGIDSAIVLALACEALGAKNVHAVMMPSRFSTDHSVSDSVKMIEKLQCVSSEIPIESLFKTYLDTLSDNFKGTEFGVAEENIQARIRGTLLMAISNKHGYILLNTSNKSELAVGYGTLYGDMCGGLAVLGDVYKTDIYELAKFINRNDEIIPVNILMKPPSAELRPGQKDTDSLPPYDLLDAVLLRYIEQAKGPDEIIADGFPKATVLRILKMVNNNEWKRFQFAPILRVSPKAFGRGRRMPLVASYLGNND